VLDIKIGSMLLLPGRRVKTILKDNGVLSILSEGVVVVFSYVSDGRVTAVKTKYYCTAFIWIHSNDLQFNSLTLPSPHNRMVSSSMPDYENLILNRLK
jgi:hypothetical protein